MDVDREDHARAQGEGGHLRPRRRSQKEATPPASGSWGPSEKISVFLLFKSLRRWYLVPAALGKLMQDAGWSHEDWNEPAAGKGCRKRRRGRRRV